MSMLFNPLAQFMLCIISFCATETILISECDDHKISVTTADHSPETSKFT